VWLLVCLGYCHEFYQQVLYLRMDIERLRKQPPLAACDTSRVIGWSERIVGWMSSDYSKEDCEEYEHKITRLPIPNPLTVAWDMIATALFHPLVVVADFIGIAVGKLMRHHSVVIQVSVLVCLLFIVYFVVVRRCCRRRTERPFREIRYENVLKEFGVRDQDRVQLLIKDD
jgi:hypothetical protein